MLIVIDMIVRMTSVAEGRSNPMRTNVTKKIASTEIPSANIVSSHMVRYCS
jgi:hypothetical protein